MRTIKHKGGLGGRLVAFTLIELLVVMGIIGILTSMLMTGLPRAKALALRIKCANHMRQLGLSLAMYSDDNDDSYPPRRRKTGTWAHVLVPYYSISNILQCPKDSPTNSRSYIFNGFNDWFQANLEPNDFVNKYLKWTWPNGLRESAIQNTSETIVFGEKVSTNLNYHMDFAQGKGNDISVVDNGRHGFGKPEARGSNYVFADTSVRYLKYGVAVYPINLWAIENFYRNPPAIPCTDWNAFVLELVASRVAL